MVLWPASVLISKGLCLCRWHPHRAARVEAQELRARPLQAGRLAAARQPGSHRLGDHLHGEAMLQPILALARMTIPEVAAMRWGVLSVPRRPLTCHPSMLLTRLRARCA